MGRGLALFASRMDSGTRATNGRTGSWAEWLPCCTIYLALNKRVSISG